MDHETIVVAVALSMLGVGLPTAVAGGGNSSTDGRASGQAQEYIVGFYEMPDRRDSYQGEPVRFVAEELEYFVVETENSNRFKEEARQDDRVRYLEENHRDYQLQFTPDDGRYSDQYGPQITNTESAWDTTLGSTSVKLGLLDSGITTDHEDFVDSRVSGYDYVNGDSTIDDHSGCGYHGSHTAGTAAATTNNGVGIAGMSESSIIMHKIFDGGNCGAATTSDIAQALKDLGDKGAHLSSNSWGGGGSSTLNDAIDYANDKGVIHVAAAGNDGSCTDCVNEPWKSRPAKVLIASCTDSNDDFCSFSSQGPEVDLASPGSSVLSVDGGDLNGYTRKSGTSMSTPHVAGAVALYIDANGDETHSDMETLVGNSADDIGLSAARQGDGRLNSGALVGSSDTNSGPTADFTSSCSDLNCTFDASGSSDSDGNISSYDWEFGDGTTGSGEVVDHSYDAGGTYTVNLTVTDDDGATDSASKTISLASGDALFADGFEDGDLAEWTLSGDSTNLWRAADDCQTPASGSWQMAFSRPASDCDYDVGHALGTADTPTVDASGADSVTLTFDHFYDVESYDGEYDVMQVQVSEDGGSSWTTLDQWDARDDTNSQYTAKSYNLTSYASSSLQVRFSFDSVDDVSNDNPGWYVDDVEIAATSSGGNSAPSADFSSSCDDLACSFDGSSSSDSDGSIASYDWELGDGTTATGEVVNHTYDSGGDYVVNLTVTDDDGATDTTSQTVSVSPNSAPTADFTASCSDLTCDFDASNSSDSDGSIASYEWELGDGTTATGEVVNHTYDSGGDYVVNLTVTDDDGATDTTSQTVSVSPNSAPSAAFTASCTDLTCDFDASNSSDSDGSIASYDWEFGDGTTGAGQTVSHTYDAAGNYTVNLTVTDDDGATDTTSDVVSVSGSGSSAGGIHVGDLDGSGSSGAGGDWTGTVTVLVHDADHNAEDGSTVTVDYQGDKSASGTLTCTTGTDGTCQVSKTFHNRESPVDFTVTDITDSDGTYSSPDNHDPDGDSDGTTITVSKS